jgi:MFS family permease
MRAFFLLCVSRAGLCLGTMMFAGALPTIRSEWQLDAASAGTVQTVFSLTNALALLVASWWCDSLGAHRVYLLFSWLGAAALMLFAVFAHSYAGALVLMAFVGLTQGGAYTPALLLAMGMNGPARRGYAIGMMLAASSLGYFLSVFIAGWSAMRWGAGVAFSLCAAGALLGALAGSLALVGYREPQPRTLGRQTKRESYAITYATLLLLVGYIAHSWELLGNWAWAPSLVSEALSGFSLDPLSAGLIVAAVIHLAGMVATLIVGTVSDYFNRASVLMFMGAAGALGSLLMGWSAGLDAAGRQHRQFLHPRRLRRAVGRDGGQRAAATARQRDGLAIVAGVWHWFVRSFILWRRDGHHPELGHVLCRIGRRRWGSLSGGRAVLATIPEMRHGHH